MGEVVLYACSRELQAIATRGSWIGELPEVDMSRDGKKEIRDDLERMWVPGISQSPVYHLEHQGRMGG